PAASATKRFQRLTPRSEAKYVPGQLSKLCVMFFRESFFAVGMVKTRPSNSVLERIPSNEFEAISGDLKPVDLASGSVLFEPGQAADSVYFPIDSVISFVGDTGEGGSIEVWAV